MKTYFSQPLDFLSGAEGDRTPDLMTASHALSHLSYSPNTLIRDEQEYRSHRRLSRAAQVASAVLILEINWYRTAIRIQGPGSCNSSGGPNDQRSSSALRPGYHGKTSGAWQAPGVAPHTCHHSTPTPYGTERPAG